MLGASEAPLPAPRCGSTWLTSWSMRASACVFCVAAWSAVNLPAATAPSMRVWAAFLSAVATSLAVLPCAVATCKTANDVATALKNAAHTRIDGAVAAGRLTADQAATQKTQADARIDQLVNQVLPQRGAGKGASEAPSI